MVITRQNRTALPSGAPIRHQEQRPASLCAPATVVIQPKIAVPSPVQGQQDKPANGAKEVVTGPSRRRAEPMRERWLTAAGATAVMLGAATVPAGSGSGPTEAHK
jgi:hypothetical protein